MRVWLASLVLTTAFIAGLIACAPLSAGLVWARAGDVGLTASTVSGTLWSGQLSDARLRGFPLGQVRARLDALALLGGQARLTLTAEEGRATLLGGAMRGIDDARLTVGLDRLGLALPNPGAVTLGDVTVAFAHDGCARAGGTVSSDILQRSWNGPAIAGVFRCEGAAAVAHLAGADARTRVAADLTVAADGGWRLVSRVTSADATMESAVALAGFQRTASGLERTDAGRLGG